MTAECSPAQATTRHRMPGRRTLVAILTAVVSIAGLVSAGVSPAGAALTGVTIDTQHAPNPVEVGGQAQFTVSVTQDGTTRDVALRISGQPAGVTLTTNNVCLGQGAVGDGTFPFNITLQTSALTPVGNSQSFTITATRYNSTNNTCAGSPASVSTTGSLNVVAANPAPSITSANSSNFAAGVAGSFQVVATRTPTSYSVAPPLPSGVTLNPSTGLISGTAAISGVYPVTLTATNSMGGGTQNFFLNVWSSALACGQWRSITAPTGVQNAIFTTSGGGGGGGGWSNNGLGSGDGAGGAVVGANYAIPAGQTIWVNIGCGGGGGNSNNGGAGGSAGLGGATGGVGGNSLGSSPVGAGGGGGGATVVCLGSQANCGAGAVKIAIAAGGGGGGGNACSGTAGDGGRGAGGNTLSGSGYQGQSGANGGVGGPDLDAGGGSGGTTSGGTGGAGGPYSSGGGGSPGNTSTGSGGAGGSFNSNDLTREDGGGGGGGGWTGGGGGGANGCQTSAAGAGGGGAGSSWVNTNAPLPTSISFNAQTTPSTSCGQTTTNGTSLLGGQGGGGATTNAIAYAGCAGTISLSWALAPLKLFFSQQPTGAASGATISPAVKVQIQDAAGNLVNTTAAVALAMTSGTGTLSGTTSVAAVAGEATFTNLSVNLAGAKTLTASSAGITNLPSSSFTITAGPANKLFFSQQPTGAASGATISPAVKVQIQDAAGNLVNTTAAVALAMTSGTGTLSGTTSVAAVAGEATFTNLSVNLAGAKTLTASSAGITNLPSSSFTITAGPANKLFFSQQPTGAASGATISPAVKVQIQDAAGNLVNTTAAVALAMTSGTGTLSGTTSVAAVAGEATFTNLSVNLAGAKTLTASSAGITNLPSSSFTITAGPANKLFFSQQPTGAASGATISPAVKVQIQDAAGNLVNTTAAVALAMTSGTGTLSGTTSVAAVAGEATFTNLSVNLAGAKTLTASSAGITNLPSSSFTITAGPAAQVVITQQPNDSTTGVAFPSQPQVTLRDAAGNTYTGPPTHSVSLGITPGSGTAGATLTCTANPTSAAAGVANFAGCKIDKPGTGYTLTATVNGLMSLQSAPFTVSVLVRNGARLTDQVTETGSQVASLTYSYCAGFSQPCTTWTPIVPSTNLAEAYEVIWTGQPANGQYLVRAEAIDNAGNASGPGGSIPVTIFNQPALHISAITGSSTNAGFLGLGWTATPVVTVRDQDGNAVSGVAVAGSWSPNQSPNSCTTNASGQCSFTTGTYTDSRFGGPESATWTVSNLAKPNYIYNPSANSQNSVTITEP